MYQNFYGLQKKPFEITPDPQFMYASAQYREALATLLYGVKEKKGLIVLTGEVGTGKTLLIRCLLQMLDEKTRTAYILNPRLDLIEFFQAVAHDFGLKGDLSTKTKFLTELNEFLFVTARDGGRAVLIVDEAQNLSLPILEEIRLLMNLETSKEKLLQVILAGQPELHRIINFSCMRQFKQRISLRAHLNPLSRKETREYIHKRLEVAGYGDDGSLFSSRAIRCIHRYTRGIPRLINVVCDNALLTGYATEKKQIDPAIVEEVIGDLEGRSALKGRENSWPRDESELAMEWARPREEAPRRRRWAVMGALALGAAVAAGLLLAASGRLPEPLFGMLQGWMHP